MFKEIVTTLVLIVNFLFLELEDVNVGEYSVDTKIIENAQPKPNTLFLLKNSSSALGTFKSRRPLTPSSLQSSVSFDLIVYLLFCVTEMKTNFVCFLS